MQVERALILWRDDHLEYDRKTLKHLRRTSAQDFSGTNYKSITLGWLERIREKRKKDNTFFAKVCKEARDIYFAMAGKGKAGASGSADKNSDVEIEERIGVMSDADSDDLNEGISMQVAANDGGNGNNGDDGGANDGDSGNNSDDEGARPLSDGGNGNNSDDEGNENNGDDEDSDDEDCDAGDVAKDNEADYDSEGFYGSATENGNGSGRLPVESFETASE